jgi:hypothetical protein
LLLRIGSKKEIKRLLVMLDLLFISFILASVVYLLLSPRKEFPLLVLLHTALQYTLTMLVWHGNLPPSIAAISMGCMWAAAIVLVWGRSLNYSYKLKFLKYALSVFQWVIFIGLMVNIFAQDGQILLLTGNSIGGADMSRENQMSQLIIEMFHFGANILVFTTFLHIVLQWGQRWTIQKSLVDLGPAILYFFSVLAMQMLHSSHYLSRTI